MIVYVCTVVLSLEPGERMPLLLLGVRDELTDRQWRPPARHWPGTPLVGGVDIQAGGTWLAVHPDIPRVACLLNGRGTAADPGRRHSRGELPLRAAAEGPGALKRLADDPAALAAYDPFHLICATPDAVTALTWLGTDPTVPPVPREIGPGTHLFSNSGHAYPADPAHPEDPVGDPKAARFGDRFAAARPSGDPALDIVTAWGGWLTLAAGDGLDRADPRAIIVGKQLPDGRVYGSTSLTLVALAPDAVRYDFQPEPGGVTGWYPVALSS
jgi:Transport and Golgi organisation 2